MLSGGADNMPDWQDVSNDAEQHLDKKLVLIGGLDACDLNTKRFHDANREYLWTSRQEVRSTARTKDGHL